MKHYVFKSLSLTALIASTIFSTSVCFAKDNKESSVMELESFIVGDKEQPAVSYFVPWKGTQAPDDLQWNIEEKNDKTLDIIDREVMIRSLKIYKEMDLEGAPK